MEQSLAVKVVFKWSWLKMRATINSAWMDSSAVRKAGVLMMSSDQLCKA